MKYEVWDEFSFGEYAELGAWRAPKNSWTGSNVILYTDGLVGPRPGLRKLAVTGTNPVGKVWGFFYPALPAKPLMVFVGDGIYASSTDGGGSIGTLTLQDTLAAEPTEYVQVTFYDPNGDLYIASPGDRNYFINWTSGVVSDLPVQNVDSAGAAQVDPATNLGTNTIVLCRDRLYAAGSVIDNGQRTYVSGRVLFTEFDPSDASGPTWFDVGYFWEVYAIVQAQNSLLFGLKYGGWFALVGATPQGDLRQVETYLSPGKQHEVVAGDNGNIFYWSGWSAGAEPDPTLCTTNGAKFDEQTYRHIRLAGMERFGVYLDRYKALVYNSDEGNVGWIRHTNAWAKIAYSVPISGPLTYTGTDYIAVMVGGDSAGTAANYYSLRVKLDRPGFTSDGDSQPGDDSTTALNAWFYTNAFRPAKDVRVRRIIVDFKKWNTGATGGNNSFNVILRQYGRYNLPDGANDDYEETTSTWTEAASYTSTTGQMDRYTARIGQQGKASAFQVGITGMIGVAIERITVEYDEDTPEGRPI